jgi:hypothetical protein
VYSQRHAGLIWIVYWLLPYRRLVWLSIQRMTQQFHHIADH